MLGLVNFLDNHMMLFVETLYFLCMCNKVRVTLRKNNSNHSHLLPPVEHYPLKIAVIMTQY